jgi:hypothetical protein
MQRHFAAKPDRRFSLDSLCAQLRSGHRAAKQIA